jgi:phosphatidylserine/phosphatidylglycerophosphate/cardiolipin synthase-like enzyme
MCRSLIAISAALALSACSACEEQTAEQVERGRAELDRSLTKSRELLDRDEDEEDEAASPPPPEREGNRARLLINGEAAFLERLRLIDEAERSIVVQALIFKADSSGGAIADRLIARKRERPDIDIRVIVDAYANIQDYDAQMLYFELIDAGIDVQGYEPFYLEWINEIDTRDWAAGHKRYHEKYLVVDGERAIVGGMNIGDEYARVGRDPALIWRDQDVYLEGPVVSDIARAFDENYRSFRQIQARRPSIVEPDRYWEAWRQVHPGLRRAVTASLGRDRTWRAAPRAALDRDALRSRRVESPLHDEVAVRFVRSRPRLGERWIDEAYRREIDRARSSIVIANAYLIPTPGIRQALIDAARRGVAITLITNSRETNDIPMINDAGRLHYRALMDASIAIYEWHAERHGEGTIHAKLAVFDEAVAIVGSYNLDPRSLALNSEDVVVIDDARIASELHQRVTEVDLRMAERVTAAQATAWSDPNLVPRFEDMPRVPWWDPRFDADRFELFLIGQAGGVL